MQQAYLYKWTQLSTGRWYIGCRTAKGCHPDDGYTCSSKIVKPMIHENRDDWQRELMCIGAPDYIRELECKVLIALDAANDPDSFNQYNNDLKFIRTAESMRQSGRQLGARPRSAEHRAKIAASKRGKKRPPITDEWREKLRFRPQNGGKNVPPETRAKQSLEAVARNNKLYMITSPEGDQTTTNNLRGWCKQQFPDTWKSAQSNLRKKPYRGWTVEQITP